MKRNVGKQMDCRRAVYFCAYFAQELGKGGVAMGKMKELYYEQREIEDNRRSLERLNKYVERRCSHYGENSRTDAHPASESDVSRNDELVIS